MLVHKILFLLTFQLSLKALAAPEEVHHPAPQKPLYLSESWYDTLKVSVPKPPEKNSRKQRRDERELRKLQKGRREETCAAAKSEILVSLKAFYGTPESPIKPAELEQLSPFFEQLRNDADYFVQKLKIDYPRERPFNYLSGLEPCVAREVTGAYPSGHAVLSRLFLLVLTDIYPEYRTFLTTRSQEIADHRVIVGMHHRSDVEAGQKIGDKVYGELKKSAQFQADLEKAKTSVGKGRT